MIEKIRPVGNPLTIIAIFAALAELAGSVVLALVPVQVQTVFVWFVMLFPSALVLMFFITLWNKNHVLYAPKDFANEDNYMAFLGNSGKLALAKTFDHLERKFEELDRIVRPMTSNSEIIPADDAPKVDPIPPPAETEKDQPNKVDVKAVDEKFAEIKSELAKAQLDADRALMSLAYAENQDGEAPPLSTVIYRFLRLYDQPLTVPEIAGAVGRGEGPVRQVLRYLTTKGKVRVTEMSDGIVRYEPVLGKTKWVRSAKKVPADD